MQKGKTAGSSGKEPSMIDRGLLNKLLAFCLGSEHNEEKEALLKCLSMENWEALMLLSVRHGTAPLLYHRLKEGHREVIMPSEIKNTLRLSYMSNLARNTKIYHELRNVLRCFNTAGIPAILLKGAHLAADVYGDIALRPMTDLDILVKADDLVRAFDILVDEGYSPEQHVNIDTVCSVSKHVPKMTGKNGLRLDLHWTIKGPSFPFPVSAEDLWESAQPLMAEGMDTLVLSREDLLTYLCIHFSLLHCFDNSLRPLCDIHQAIERFRGALDWQKVTKRTHAWRADKSVALSLYLAKKWLHTHIPEEMSGLLDGIRSDFDVIGISEELIFTDNALVSDNIVRLSSIPGLADKTRHFMQMTFRPKIVMAANYPVSVHSPLIYLYYLVRVKDLLARNTATVWNLLRHRRTPPEYLRLSIARTKLRDWMLSS
jgi:hypothetical protein